MTDQSQSHVSLGDLKSAIAAICTDRDEIRAVLLVGSAIASIPDDLIRTSTDIDVLVVLRFSVTVDSYAQALSAVAIFRKLEDDASIQAKVIFNGIHREPPISGMLYVDVIFDGLPEALACTARSSIHAIRPRVLLFGSDPYPPADSVQLPRALRREVLLGISHYVDRLIRESSDAPRSILKQALSP